MHDGSRLKAGVTERGEQSKKGGASGEAPPFLGFDPGPTRE